MLYKIVVRNRRSAYIVEIDEVHETNVGTTVDAIIAEKGSAVSLTIVPLED